MVKTIQEKEGAPNVIEIIDQRALPFELKIQELSSYKEAIFAIKEMLVRGAPLIGVTGAYGLWLAACEALQAKDFNYFLQSAALDIIEARPTAVNLKWAVKKALDEMPVGASPDEKAAAILASARRIAREDAEQSRLIGMHGLELIKKVADRKKGKPVNILTHCNAGRLAAIEWGTATAPIYAANEAGIDVHVWVDETRPRNQGSKLTCWELAEAGVKHTLIADNTGGHLMQHGMVDLVIVGCDRASVNGDVANKIGTYLKALAAKDNNIPFYAAFPSSTIDWELEDGVNDIPIEERNSEELLFIEGLAEGKNIKALIAPVNTQCVNYAFDVTPSRLVTGIITERGVCNASKEGLLELFPEHKL